jgi:hypothetical protein
MLDISGHLIDHYSGYLDKIALDKDSAPESEEVVEIRWFDGWPQFFRSLKVAFTPQTLWELKLRDLSYGSLKQHVFNKGLKMHQAETDLWIAWIMGQRNTEPTAEEILLGECPSDCSLCRRMRINELSHSDVDSSGDEYVSENEGAWESEDVSEDEYSDISE